MLPTDKSRLSIDRSLRFLITTVDLLIGVRTGVAINYIISKGISRHRLTARGLGEEQLRNHCADDTYCSEEEHQENRRTEVRVLKR